MSERLPESEILADVLVKLTAIPGVIAFRNNSGLFFTKTGRPVRASVKGAADILGAARGVPLAVETKTAIGRQSKAQKNFQAAWELAGGLYILARSFDDVAAALRLNA